MQSDRHVYSLKAILDSDRLDPDLCKLMLNEIKSPLLQHSFQMTADDDATEKNSGSLIFNNKPDKTLSQIKPKFPDHNHLDSFSMTNSYYETSNKIDNKQRKVHNEIFEKFAESIVSPLEHHKFLGEEQQREDFHIRYNNTEKQESPKGGINRWCGGVFNPNLEEYSNQLIFDPKEYHYVRRKIFKNRPKQQETNFAPIKKYNFLESANKLSKIEQPQLSNFLIFISKTLPLLAKLTPYLKNLGRNTEIVNELLLEHSPVNYETKQSYQNCKRIYNRLQSHKTSQMLNKLITNTGDYSPKNYSNQRRHYVQSDIEFIFKTFNQVEAEIQNYVSQKETPQQLRIIYGLLYDSQSFPQTKISRLDTPIQSLHQQQKPSSFEHSLKIKLIRLFSSLKIDDHLYENLGELRYIWPDIEQPGGYRAIDKFLKQICRNDVLIEPKGEFPQQKSANQKCKSVINKLEMEGFRKNV